MEDLKVRPYNGVGFNEHFSMDRIEVDGIITDNPRNLHANYFFSIKEEEDVFGNPRDTGTPFRWRPDHKISETHWLKCGNLVPLHSICFICGNRYIDETDVLA